jgi:hypothetical protein
MSTFSRSRRRPDHAASCSVAAAAQDAPIELRLRLHIQQIIHSHLLDADDGRERRRTLDLVERELRIAALAARSLRDLRKAATSEPDDDEESPFPREPAVLRSVLAAQMERLREGKKSLTP